MKIERARDEMNREKKWSENKIQVTFLVVEYTYQTK
jgi:hypothetical protein